jgi:hypothetical protein
MSRPSIPSRSGKQYGRSPWAQAFLHLLLVNDGDPVQEILADSASPSDAHFRKIVHQREGGKQIVHVHLTPL